MRKSPEYKTIGVRLTMDEWAALKELSAKNVRSMSSMMRFLVLKELGRLEDED